MALTWPVESPGLHSLLVLRGAGGPMGKVCLEGAQGPGSGKWLLPAASQVLCDPGRSLNLSGSPLTTVNEGGAPAPGLQGQSPPHRWLLADGMTLAGPSLGASLPHCYNMRITPEAGDSEGSCGRHLGAGLGPTIPSQLLSLSWGGWYGRG